MRHNNIKTLIAVAALLLAGCGGGDYTPKPQAYLRIDMPEHEYFLLDTMRTNPGDTMVWPDGDTSIVLTGYTKTFPFIFEANKCIEWTEKDAPKGERWVDLMYPQWDGVVYLTYKRLRNAADLRGQIDTSSRMLEKHYQLASGVEEQFYEDAENRVYGSGPPTACTTTSAAPSSSTAPPTTTPSPRCSTTYRRTSSTSWRPCGGDDGYWL